MVKPPSFEGGWRRTLWQCLTPIAGCVLVYLLLSVGWRWWNGHNDTLWQRLHSSSMQSSGHSHFGLPVTSRSTPLDLHLDNLEPNTAGWKSETWSEAISKQLKQVSRLLQADKALSDSDFADVVASEFKGSIVPASVCQTVFDNGAFRSERLPRDFTGFPGTDSFKAQLSSMVGAAELFKLRCSFKVTQVQMQQREVVSRVLFEAVHTTDRTISQSNAVCQCVWKMDADKPKLHTLGVLELERVHFSAESRPLYDDITAAVFDTASKNDRSAFDEQVLRGLEHWSVRLSVIDDMSIYGHHGLAVGDVNQDGYEDIYVCDSGGLPNRLYMQQPDGTLQDVSKEAGIDWLESTSSALLVDLDNDGDADLVVATVAGIVVASNNGTGIFRICAAIPDISEAQSLSAADYDNDGDLDIYVTVYGPGGSAQRERGFEASPPIPYSDANNGGRNLLFENRGAFQFVDVTEQCGLDANNQRFSFAASWEDFDIDGDMDLYVANDFGRNNLYQNNEGHFRDVAAEFGVEDMAGGMSVSWGDCNQDGLMDIYVGNMYSAAGKRVTYQRRFLEGRTADSSSGIQRMARGNTLFLANQGAAFTDISQSAGVTMGRWAWSSKFADLNNDGREDLVIANGYFSSDRVDDL